MRLNNRFGCDKTMRVFWNRFCDDEDGASALEFALVFPLFATMLFGSLQMGLAYYTAGSVQYALERTARMTMVDQDMSAGQVQTAFENLLEPLTNEEIDINYTVDSSGDVPIAIFTATYTHNFVIPLVPQFNVDFPVETRVPLEPTAS
jgi:Flp pilus assembly protein TadG